MFLLQSCFLYTRPCRAQSQSDLLICSLDVLPFFSLFLLTGFSALCCLVPDNRMLAFCFSQIQYAAFPSWHLDFSHRQLPDISTVILASASLLHSASQDTLPGILGHLKDGKPPNSCIQMMLRSAASSNSRGHSLHYGCRGLRVPRRLSFRKDFPSSHY